MTLHRTIPTDQQLDEVSELYTAATGRAPGDLVDCASCTQRHERDALFWSQPWKDWSAWLLGPICEDCQTVDLSTVEANVLKLRPPLREGVSSANGQPEPWCIADPDFAKDRRS